MIGYLAGSTGSVSFSVRTYGEVIWSGPDASTKAFIQYLPTSATGTYWWYVSSTWYNSQISSTSVPGLFYPSTRYDNFYFQNCTWTDIVTNLGYIPSHTGGVFYNCSSLRTANLFSCMDLGYRAFYQCVNLNYVSLPNCLYIQEDAFAHCNLSSLELPNCQLIGPGAFEFNSNLSEVVLPKCEAIASGAFIECSNLRSVTLLYSSVVQLPNHPFGNVDAVFPSITSIFVPASLYSLYTEFWYSASSRIFSIPE